ncbi:MAG: hypothetical protein ABIQ39_09430 [Ilumatobacteraceae bacterium]
MKLAGNSGHGLWRSRWAAIGAAVAVALGGGGLLVASAADVSSSFVAVTPMRVVDSRVSLGLSGPLVATQPVVVQITGSVPTSSGSAVVVPAGATAVVANVTAVGATADGFVSVRPADATGVPMTSSLNFSPGQTVANSLTVKLPSSGGFQVYYGATSGATVHLVVDVVGYYVEGGVQGPVGPAGPAGPQGVIGDTGPAGPAGVAGVIGETGPAGPEGPQGVAGDTGPEGPQGPQGPQGATGPIGLQGTPGATGATGATGLVGPQGPAGSGVAAEFFALMPGDNAFSVATGADVQFPQDGPNTDPTGIARTSDRAFVLSAMGIYRISFQVPVNEAGQLVLTLNDLELDYTVVGRATGTSQITATALVESSSPNSILTVRNPVGQPTPLTITPMAGGTQPVSATLLIELVAAATPT